MGDTEQTQGQEQEQAAQEGRDSENAERDAPKFTQAELDRIVKERLERAEKKAAEAAAKAKAEAEQKALAEQGKYKELHDAAAARVAELEPVKERAERLEAVLVKRWEAEKTGVPDYILPLLEKMDVDERLDYITDNREKWTKAAANGVGSNPNSSSGKKLTSEELERERRENAHGIRRLF